MCGIGGIYSFSGAPVRRDRLESLSRAISHRGPDGDGIFTADGIGLAHRRLSIVDLSERAVQPICDPETGSALSFNGEIYNFEELRSDLKQAGESFRSDGDAEVLFKGLLRNGIGYLSRLEGDFAFAFWDGKERKLFLARDRFGVKPLYYAETSGELIFASEVKGILAAGHPVGTCRSALVEHLRFRYAQGEQTLFEGIRSLPPGEYVEITRNRMFRKTYWFIDPDRFSYRDYDEGLEHLEELWERAVKSRLRSDVQTGALLSGGIDSGFLAFTAQQSASWPVMSYNIPGDLSESLSSRATSEALGYSQSLVTHREDFLEGLAAVVRALEEPLGDSVVVPTYELFRASRGRMKVVLSGEGADEVFGGYAHQQALKKIFRLKELGLGPILSGAGRGMSCVPPKLLSTLTGYPVGFDAELTKRARTLLGTGEPGDAYDLSRELFSLGELSHLLKEDFFDEKDAIPRKSEWKQGNNWAGVLMGDLRTWLPNYGLLRIDKLSMAHGLECRVPYLHHEFAEAALSLTLREGSGMRAPAKKVLRDLVRRKCGNLPFAKRKKQPFFLPLERSESMDRLCREYLSEECLKKTEVFEPRTVEGLLRGRGSFIGDKKLFCVLSIQMWLQESGKNFSRVAPIFVTAIAIALSR